MTQINLLLVDDEVRILRSLKILFRKTCEIFLATGADAALGILKNHPIHVVISDQRMPGNSGVELLKQAKAISPDTVRILLTGYSDLDAVLDSINTGEVFRYVSKPWVNDELKRAVLTAASISRGAGPNDTLTDGKAAARVSGGVGILLLRGSRDISASLATLIPKHYSLFTASNLEGAVKLMEREKIGVVVADISGLSSNNVLMIKILKREYPGTITIAVTDNPDAATAVELINQGQVFRYITQLDPNRFVEALVEAMWYYHECEKNPDKLSRHQLDELKRNEEVMALKKIRERIPAIRRSLRLLLQNRASPDQAKLQ